MNTQTDGKQSRLILISGGIGSGKTTLTRLLEKHLSWDTGYESVEDNPFLSDFYSDMNRWVFHLGAYYLCSRAKQHNLHANTKTLSVLDRSIYEDVHVFVPALYQMGVISDREYKTYFELWELIEDTLHLPDLLIYLEAAPGILLERISLRGRAMESGIDLAYLQLLEDFYSNWVDGFTKCPVLKIDTVNNNYLDNHEQRNLVFKYIKTNLNLEGGN